MLSIFMIFDSIDNMFKLIHMFIVGLFSLMLYFLVWAVLQFDVMNMPFVLESLCL